MNNRGYISLHRQILDNAIWNIKPFSKGQAWVTILLLTNHKIGYMPIKNGQLLKIERGECGYSDTALADIFGWSRAKVKRFLILLETQKMVQLKNRCNRNIINILNYDYYQNGTLNVTVNDTVNEHLTLQQTNTNNNENNENNENNISSSVEEEKLKDLKNYYGEFKNVHLTKRQLDKIKTFVLNKDVLSVLIDDLSKEIASKSGRYLPYDAKFPNMHYAYLLKFWEYRKNKPVKIKEDKGEEDNGYNYGIG